jgi:hypothetical protein
MWIIEEALPMADMPGAKRRRKQHLDRLPEQLISPISEQTLRLRVGK